MTDMQEIRIEVLDGVALITLDRPDRLNAYTPDMGDELVGAFRSCAADESIGAIVITGEGRAFCAGADKDFLSGQRGRNGLALGEEYFIAGFANELFAIEKPIIAAINGPAIGIGATMLLPFDIRLAARRATLGFPFAKLGVMPGMGSTCLLPELVGLSKCKEILLSAATLDSQAALATGLVSRVVADGELLDEALALGRLIASHSRDVIAACKRQIMARPVPHLANAIKGELHEVSILRKVCAT